MRVVHAAEKLASVVEQQLNPQARGAAAAVGRTATSSGLVRW